VRFDSSLTSESRSTRKKNRMKTFWNAALPRRSSLFCVLALLIGCWILSGGNARAAIIFDNLASGNNGFLGVSPTNWNAQRFNSDATNLVLTKAILNTSSSGSGGNVFLSVYSDNSGTPGASLATLYSGSDPGNVATFSGLHALLAPSTNYWLVLGGNSGAPSTLGWGVTFSQTGLGSGFQNIAKNTTNQGASWSAATGTPFQMQLTASPAPEPNSALLGLIAGGCLVFVLRRQNSLKATGVVV